MKLLNTHFWKFFCGLLGIVAVGLFVAYGTNYYSNYKLFHAERERQEAQRAEAERIRKLYEEDTYGGKTPEETLALFIDALKKGDTDLAAKYFVIEDREQQKTYLDDVKAKNDLLAMATDAQKLKLTKNDGERAFFVLTNEKGVVIVQVVLAKNSQNGVWKIMEL